MKHALRLLTLVAAMMTLPGLSNAQSRPLPLEGYSTVYQRVLTRPGTLLTDGPGQEGGVLQATFTPLYVYARQGDALHVGLTTSSGPTGWVEQSNVVEWQHNIVATFTTPQQRNRQVLFEDMGAVQDLINHENVIAMQTELLGRADSGTLESTDRVVTVEPELPVSLEESFYILPILSYEEMLNPINYRNMLLMEMASLPLEDDEEPPAPETPFDAGIIFLLDTTQSMEPYIRATRDAVARIMAGMSDPEVGANIHFGVIGFRDNPDAAPGLEYRTRVYAPLERRDGAGQVLEALDQIEVATVSSPGFNEDAFAGIEDALAQDWEPDERPFGGRYIILITDAGPKAPSDPNARSQIDGERVRVMAREAGAAVVTIHLKSAAGAAGHSAVETIYRGVSRQNTGDSLYYPVPDGDEAVFSQQITRLVSALTNQVRLAAGLDSEIPEEELDQALEDAGNAMRLRWLGQQRGATAPDVIRFWGTDTAVDNPDRIALRPRLLVTRNELSTMTTLLSEIIRLAEETGDENAPEDLFRQVRGVVSRMARNPDMAVNAEFDTLGEAFGEALRGLPYRSQIMTMTETRWIASAAERRVIIDELRSRLAYYRRVQGLDVWTALSDDAPDGEYVYAIPFETLP